MTAAHFEPLLTTTTITYCSSSLQNSNLTQLSAHHQALSVTGMAAKQLYFSISSQPSACFSLNNLSNINLLQSQQSLQHLPVSVSTISPASPCFSPCTSSASACFSPSTSSASVCFSPSLWHQSVSVHPTSLASAYFSLNNLSSISLF